MKGLSVVAGDGRMSIVPNLLFINHEILAQDFHKFNLFFVMEIMISWLQNTGYGKVGETLQAKFYLIVNDGRKLFNEKWFQIYDNPVNLLYQGCKVLEDINEVLLLSGVHRRTEVIVISNWHYVVYFYQHKNKWNNFT